MKLLRGLVTGAIALAMVGCHHGRPTPEENTDRAAAADTKDGTDPTKTWTKDGCDQIRKAAMKGEGVKHCSMVTSRGIVELGFNKLGYPNFLESIDTADGAARRFMFGDNSIIAKSNIVLIVHAAVWETMPDHATVQPTFPATGVTDSRGRPFYMAEDLTLTQDLMHRHISLVRKGDTVQDTCDAWWKSAEGSRMTALVQHSDGATKTYQAWWDGKSTFPLHCGRFVPYRPSLAQFQEVFDRFVPAGEAKVYLSEVARKFGTTYEPGVVSAFAIAHAAHQAAKGRPIDTGTIVQGTEVPVNPAQDFLDDVGEGLMASAVLGAAGGLAATEGGPAAQWTVGSAVFSWSMSGVMVHAIWKQIRIQQEIKRRKDEFERDRRSSNSEDEDADSDGDGIPDVEDPDADGDGVDDASDPNFGLGPEEVASNDGTEGESNMNLDGSPDPSGGAWNDGDGSDLNPPTDPWGPNDPWCPTVDCDRDPSIPSGLASRPIHPV